CVGPLIGHRPAWIKTSAHGSHHRGAIVEPEVRREMARCQKIRGLLGVNVSAVLTRCCGSAPPLSRVTPAVLKGPSCLWALHRCPAIWLEESHSGTRRHVDVLRCPDEREVFEQYAL